MATDFSRVRLNPLLNYAGVELKQGGVLLDADANELSGILDRRLRALASDVLGRATVSSTTPDAFKIAVAGASFTIGKGRLYVDGLLAENHGAASTDPAKQVFDSLLAEPQFADPVNYAAQPYLQAPPALPAAGRHLVYLDVWDREVTYLEEPDLVESAVGVDASSRVQTVWQVRALAENAGAGATCLSPDADIAGWSALIAPSTGVLTTGTFETAPVDDPCELPPTGGYRGLENQLYRVEIHNSGQPGAGATFKWSRENASVGSRVASMVSASELELVTLGRDDVLSFKTGDWVEIIDDQREFSQAGGEMRRITVFEATRRIQFAPALPAAMIPAAFPNSAFPDARNLRVRRWDQGGRVFRTDVNGTPVEVQNLDAAASPGVINVPVATVTLLLENGVTVAFASTGAKGFKAGDYWVFAARTSDATVELLNRAPPRGIHHHFARLGIWDVGAASVTDCRHPWPPAGGEGHDCSCTACVTAESHASGAFTIQDAVNAASQTGGTVCIGPGQFALAEPVRMAGIRSVRVRGQGTATLLAAAGGAFLIENSQAVGVESLAILALGQRPAISARNVIGLKLGELLIGVFGVNDRQASAVALQGVIAAARISGNAFFAPSGILANDPSADGEGDGQNQFLLTADISIADNIFWCADEAIRLDGRVMHLLQTSISDNDILACSKTGVSALGIGLEGSSVRICGNSLSVAGHGIQCAFGGAWISENKIVNVARRAKDTGIAIAGGLDKRGLDQCQILANQIQGFGFAGIMVSAPVASLIIKLNIIEDCGNGILFAGRARAGTLSIENNHLRNIDTAGENQTGRVIGIGVTRAGSAAICGNTIRALGTQSEQSSFRAGVLMLGVERARVTGNDIVEFVPLNEFLGRAAAIALLAVLADFEVSHNHTERDASEVEGPGQGNWSALFIAAAGGRQPVTRLGNLTAIRIEKSKTLAFGGGRAFVAAGAISGQGANGSVLGNRFNARGQTPAVEVSAEDVLFNDNRVEARFNKSEAAVTLTASIAIVNANRVIGGEQSIRIIGADAKTAAVLGNITTKGISLNGSAVPPPWDALNLRA